MLPLEVFGSRQFTAVNVVTFVVYAALGAVFFLLVLELQVVSGFSPLKAGLALLPATVLMLLLSARAGALAQRMGPRWLMTVGILTSAAGVLLLTRIGPHASYLADVVPGVALFGLGLSATVAPLTATVLASADVRHAGVASGVNNAVARAAGLLAVAGLPLAVGLTGARLKASAFEGGFRAAMVICAALLVAGAVLSALTINSNVLRPQVGREVRQPECLTFCGVGAPPLEPAGRHGSAVAGPAAHWACRLGPGTPPACGRRQPRTCTPSTSTLCTLNEWARTHALVTDAHPDPPGRPGGRGCAEPPAVAPRRVHSAAHGRALLAAAARPPGAGQGHRDHPAGDEPDRRAGSTAARHAPGGDLAAQRPLGGHGRGDVPAHRPQGRATRTGYDPRGDFRDAGHGAELAQGASAGLVPIPDEVPRRAQAAGRAAPDPRVHHEGLLQLRHRPGGARRRL